MTPNHGNRSTPMLRATVTKRWCLEQLNTFSVSIAQGEPFYKRWAKNCISERGGSKSVSLWNSLPTHFVQSVSTLVNEAVGKNAEVERAGLYIQVQYVSDSYRGRCVRPCAVGIPDDSGSRSVRRHPLHSRADIRRCPSHNRRQLHASNNTCPSVSV